MTLIATCGTAGTATGGRLSPPGRSGDAPPGNRKTESDRPPAPNIPAFQRLQGCIVTGLQHRLIVGWHPPPGSVATGGARKPPYAPTFSSIRSQIAFSICTPSNRAISCNPVGEVTLISVR